MNNPTKTVVIVGGGTAGWLTAGQIAARHYAGNISANGTSSPNNSSPEKQDVKVILVESPTIPTVGVGEGTWPTMRNTLIQLGISETDFIRECDASFKQGAKFAKWVDGSDSDFYYHPLVLPQGFAKGDLAAYWLAMQNESADSKSQDQQSFSNSVCYQESICEQGLAPKTIRSTEFGGIANYAYHLDAGKFSKFLKQHCLEKLGVIHISDDVIGVNSAQNGDIASVATKNNGDIAGDLFVDCSGFKSLLLGEHYQVPFVDCDDVLFIDSALAVQVPYQCDDSSIASHTISTAQQAGWIWDIGLQSRRGVGHVYSSRHTSEIEAKQILADYIGETVESLKFKKITFRSGHREKFWHKNCVAVGLSAGFLEPLEASALVLVELSAKMISEQLPASREAMDIVGKRFNQTFLYRWDKIIDFLKLHYILSKRTDNKFWIDNRDPDTIPESLKDLMTLWRYRSPADLDFTSNNEVFPAASYQYVLYGMGFKSDYSHLPHCLNDQAYADQQFAQNKKLIQQALNTLPSNRDLINKIKQFGFNAL